MFAMTAGALVLESGQVEALTKAPHVSMVTEITECLRLWTESVERWEMLSSEDQKGFRKLARILDNPPRVGFLQRLKVSWVIIRAGVEAYDEYREAFLKFREALQTVLERENRTFEMALTDKELVEGSNRGWEEAQNGDLIPFEEALERLGQS